MKQTISVFARIIAKLVTLILTLFVSTIATLIVAFFVWFLVSKIFGMGITSAAISLIVGAITSVYAFRLCRKGSKSN